MQCGGDDTNHKEKSLGIALSDDTGVVLGHRIQRKDVYLWSDQEGNPPRALWKPLLQSLAPE